jgi:hypothetical protein
MKKIAISILVSSIVRHAMLLNALCSFVKTATDETDFLVMTTKHTFDPKISIIMQNIK